MDKCPTPISGQNVTTLSQGLLAALREPAKFGIRLALGEVVAGCTTDSLSAKICSCRLPRVISAQDCDEICLWELFPKLAEIYFAKMSFHEGLQEV